MKTWQKVFLGALIGTIVILIGILLIPALSDASWWWFGGTLIFFLFAWIVVGIILLVIKLNKKPPVKLKIDLKDAKKRTIHEMKYDDDNPDNFKIDKHKLLRIGEKGTEPTPILVLDGKGTELNQQRTVIINMNNPKQESTKLIDAPKEEIVESIMSIAEHPPEEIREKITTSLDQFGRPITTTNISRPSQREQKEQKEKEEAETAQAM